MLSWRGGVRIFISTKPTDMRKGFDGLLEQERTNVLPQSLIGKAITYTLNQWHELCLFVDDGHLPIDNNAVERGMKHIATGRKNWLFFGNLQYPCQRSPPRPRHLEISLRHPPPPRRSPARRT
jgi:hypothetical protein